MITINDKFSREKHRPVRVVQFGEGNFLRAFVDYMIDIANEKTDFDAGIAIVKPISMGTLERFDRQDKLYTVVLRGKQDGRVINESRVITSVEKAVDCGEDFKAVLSLAELDTLRFVVSNTTEAGIALDLSDKIDGVPSTYPGKLTKFLYHRFNTFNGAADKGLIILPVELIENNGGELKKCVTALAGQWRLPDGFMSWLNESCVFCSTLVDRIVTGYPRGEADKICAELGYSDELLDVGEPFALWVIESDRDVSGELPFAKIGLPVVFTTDQRPYRERKVRILNGAHTSSVLAGYLYGLDIVRDCMNDRLVGTFMRRAVREEIVPQVKLPRAEVEAFAESVFERFENPFIDHSLLSISLNSVSKWKVRVLPSFKDCFAADKKLPRLLTFSFAALLVFYRSDDLRSDGLHVFRADGTEYVVHDNADVLRFFADNSKLPDADFVRTAASNIDFWGEDLTLYPDFCETVAMRLGQLANPSKALEAVLGE